jgi:NCS1 family nucleobase:cation symporter-1
MHTPSWVVAGLRIVISLPPLCFPLNEWHEPKDYIRPEERVEVLEGRVADVETDSGAGDKEVGENGVSVGAV